MMGFVSLSLYAEGPTDDDFLPLVIARTAQHIFLQHQQEAFQILPVEPVGDIPKRPDRATRILEAARVAAARNHQVLIVHSDSDTGVKGLGLTLQQRFKPGATLVQQQQSGVCKYLVPIIPIQAVEAWMLADFQLLLDEIGTRKKALDLNIPEKARLVETIAKPKERLEEAIRLAFKDQSNRLRRLGGAREIRLSLYKPMGRDVDLSRLDLLGGYQAFKQDLITTFKMLHML